MINIPVPKKSHATYNSASRLIARRIGPAAPTAVALIQHELSHRDARSIASEFLDHEKRRRRRHFPVRTRA